MAIVKAISVINKSDDQNDFLYWQNKSAQERIDAIEILRLQYIQMNKYVQPGLQRVYRIIKRK